MPAGPPTYQVRSVEVGRCEVPGPEVFWMSHWGEWLPLAFQVVIIRGNGVLALVNTGPPDDVHELNAPWIAAFGERGGMRSPDGGIRSILASAGVEPAAVTHIILTPLQLYSTANIALFPDAQICLSRRGWTHFHTTHNHPHDLRWRSIPPDVLVYLVTEAWPRVKLLEDEDEVMPGISTWWAGTHHRASLAIDVETARGRCTVSDAFFYYQNVESGPILGINESMDEALRAYARARRSDLLVPLYDPEVFVRHPDGIIA